MDARDLGPRQLDALREVANIGAGHAATALSQMVNQRIMVDIPEIKIVRLEDVGEILGPPDEIVSAVMMQLLGDVTGRTVQIFPWRTAVQLTSKLLSRESTEAPEDFGELEQSALKEVSNILVGAYVNALSEFMGLMLIMSPPALAIDTAQAVLATSYLNFGDHQEYVFAVTTRLGMDANSDLGAHFLLLPDDASLKVILRALRIG
ncbi:MAG TPA: chemotaxis protein CheC [Longimicrobiales bacterium]